MTVFYGGAALAGDPARWNKVMPRDHVPGDTTGNTVLGLHLLLSVAILTGGALQLLPVLRRKTPRLHHWIGRSYIASAVVMSLGGLFMVWSRGEPARIGQHLGISRETWAREQALAFDLERSELARQALDARMRLLSTQAQPHFLFNTLAHLQALVEAGSPHAAQLLQTLTAYLRAAVPRLDDAAATLGQELDLVRAYLALMQMRMPDRLQFALHIDPTAALRRCPPLTLLTLVENAVRHGIDPSVEGGRIDIHAALRGGRCHLSVIDTGVGLQTTGGSLGTGLVALRERLHLVFGGDAKLSLSEVEPHGVRVDLDFPEQA